jgi:lysophospholipase L1-like esterase
MAPSVTHSSTVRHTLGAKIALACLSIAVGAGLCEILARAVFPAPPGDERRPQVAYLYDPEIGYVQAGNQKAWMQDQLITINSLGFRGKETMTPKPQGAVRTVIVGDSVTVGMGVGDRETFAARLEDRLRARFPSRPLDVVNLGVSGYGTRQEVALLRRYVARLEPDLVLVGFYVNDVPDALDDDAAFDARGTRIAAADPQPGQVLHINPPSASWLMRTLRKSRAIYVLGRAIIGLSGGGEKGSTSFSLELEMLQGKTTPDIERAWNVVQTQLAQLGTLAKDRGFSIGIVILPCKEQVTGRYPNDMYQARIRAIAQPLEFFVVDPLQALVASGRRADDLFIPYDRNHPSAAGHRIIGDAIFTFLAVHPPFGHAEDSARSTPEDQLGYAGLDLATRLSFRRIDQVHAHDVRLLVKSPPADLTDHPHGPSAHAQEGLPRIRPKDDDGSVVR